MPTGHRDTIVKMRRAGRVSPLFLGVIVGVAALVILLFFGQESPSAAASKFMDALARGDVKTLTDTSIVEGKSKEDVRKDWEFTTKVSRHFLFRWKITSFNQVTDDTATVKVQVERNLGNGSYEENYGLPLRKIDGGWKVVASGISREMFPGLPRSGKE